MYLIRNDDGTIRLADAATPVVRQENGYFAPAKDADAQGFCADGIIYAFPARGDAISAPEAQVEFVPGAERLQKLSEQTIASARNESTASSRPPHAEIGMALYGAEPWAAGRSYEMYDLFSYQGAVGYAKQAHTAQETWLPFSPGTEALYGARPSPDENGIYPYIYNMAVEPGMRVRDFNDGLVYLCVQAVSDLLYPPHAVPAHFILDERTHE